MTRKRENQDQGKKVRGGEDVYIQQLLGAEKSQVNRGREEKHEARRAGSGPG